MLYVYFLVTESYPKKKKKSELIPLINSQMFERTNNGRNCPVNDNRS